MTDTVKACPFCGSDATSIDDGFAYWVECTECSATSAPAIEMAEALAAWNKRPTD